MIWFLLVASLLMTAAWGYGFYLAVYEHDKFWIILWAITLGLWQGERFFNNSILRGFLEGLTK